jgi:hypothetical protein
MMKKQDKIIGGAPLAAQKSTCLSGQEERSQLTTLRRGRALTDRRCRDMRNRAKYFESKIRTMTQQHEERRRALSLVESYQEQHLSARKSRE